MSNASVEPKRLPRVQQHVLHLCGSPVKDQHDNTNNGNPTLHPAPRPSGRTHSDDVHVSALDFARTHPAHSEHHGMLHRGALAHNAHHRYDMRTASLRINH